MSKTRSGKFFGTVPISEPVVNEPVNSWPTACHASHFFTSHSWPNSPKQCHAPEPVLVTSVGPSRQIDHRIVRVRLDNELLEEQLEIEFQE